MGRPADAWWWHFIVVPLIGGVLSTALFVMMVRWTNRRSRPTTRSRSRSAHLTRYKHFLRMRIDAEGALDVYVVGLDPVGTGWYDATTGRPTVPPYDKKTGTPKLHYVWGRTFTTGKESQVLERMRTLGPGHPETLYALVGLAQRQLATYLRDGDVAKLDDAIDALARAIEGAQATHGVTHRTTISYQEALANTLIAAGGAKALDGSDLLTWCATTRLDNDLARLQLNPVPLPTLSPETTDALIKAAEHLLVSQVDHATDVVRHALYRLVEVGGLDRGVDAARLHSMMAVISLRMRDRFSARTEIDESVSRLAEALGVQHAYTQQALTIQARVRIAELDEASVEQVVVPGFDRPPPMTADDRIAALTGLLNGELSRAAEGTPCGN